MSVKISYKGAEIASISTDITKVLKTSGKYCECDISVQNTQDGGGDYDITVEADGAGQILHIVDASGGGGGMRTTSGTWTPAVDNSNISIAHNAGYSKYVMVIEAESLAGIIASADIYTAAATVYWETGMTGSVAARRNYNGADEAWSTSASGMVATGGGANSTGNITANAHLGTTYKWTVYDLGGA